MHKPGLKEVSLKTIALICSLGLISGVSVASSPFLVSPSSVEEAGAMAQKQHGSANPITLAESLVQLRQYHLKDQPPQSNTEVAVSSHTPTVNK